MKQENQTMKEMVLIIAVVSIITIHTYGLIIRTTGFDHSEKLNRFECGFYPACKNLESWNNEALDIEQAKKIADDFSDKNGIRVLYSEKNFQINVIKKSKTDKIVGRYVDGSPIYEYKYDSSWVHCKESQKHTECVNMYISQLKGEL